MILFMSADLNYHTGWMRGARMLPW